MSKRAGRKSKAQTPAPRKERIYGSKKNPKGSAASEKSASKIKLDDKTMTALKNKLKEFKEKHPNKKNITLNDLKAVYRRGAGAYSKSHRPTITGGAPNTRNAWSMARVNKFLLKAGGTKVKAAYVQDDDLMKMAKGGEILGIKYTISKGESDDERIVTFEEGQYRDIQIEPHDAIFHKTWGRMGGEGWAHIKEFGFTYPTIREAIKSYLEDKRGKKYPIVTKKKGGITLLAPNGKPSNLNSEQWHLVRTPQFKAWFGDWENDPKNASKVVDDNGEPLVVYHGSDYVFNVFKTDKQIYFATNKEYASEISESGRVKSFFINIRNLLDATKFYIDDYSYREYKTFLKKNGIDVKIISRDNEIVSKFWYLISNSSIWKSIKEKYDGFSMYENMFATKGKIEEEDFDDPFTKVYVCFEANQIKLADGTNKTFDGGNSDIRYAQGGQTFNDKELLAKWKRGESIGFTATAHLKAKGLIPRSDGTKRKSTQYKKEGGLIGGFEDLTDEWLSKKIEIFLNKVKPIKFYFVDPNTNTLTVGFDKYYSHDAAQKVYEEATSSKEFFHAPSVESTYDSKTGDLIFKIKLKKVVEYNDGGEVYEDDEYYEKTDWQREQEMLENSLVDLILHDEQYSLNLNDRYILSHEKNIEFRNKEQDNERDFKPKGLWYAFNYEWASWVYHEMPRYARDYDYVHKIEVTDKVLSLDTIDKCIEFTKRYGIEQAWGNHPIYKIDWIKVAKDYSGIEVTQPYKWSRIHEHEYTLWWLYGWDVGSGCVWNEDGIKSIELVHSYYAKGGKIDNGSENFGQPAKEYSGISFIHETKKENANSILKNGFRLGSNPRITKGIYTIPLQWKREKFDWGVESIELEIELKEGSKIFWTNTERPSDFYYGQGNKYFNNLYKKLHKGNPSLLKDGSDENRIAYNKRMEKWLDENGYVGVQQGGEIVITDPKAIEKVTKFKRKEDGGEVESFGKGGEIKFDYLREAGDGEVDNFFDSDWELVSQWTEGEGRGTTPHLVYTNGIEYLLEREDYGFDGYNSPKYYFIEINQSFDEGGEVNKFTDRFGKNKFVKLDRKDIDDFAPSLLDLIKTAYGHIGGHFEFSNVDEFKKTNLDYWVATDVDDDPDADALIGGKTTQAGTKITVGGQDGSKVGKIAMIRKMKELLEEKGFYTEMDKELAQKIGVEPIKSLRTIKKVLGKDDIEYIGKGLYSRNISGHKKEKVLVGIPKKFAKGGEVDEKVIKERWAKKKDSLMNMADNIRSLRTNLRKDLKGDDDKDRLTALAISIMDKTAERVGNDESESNGHLGITGLSKRNVKVEGNTITLKYIGKSGVKHEKQFSDEGIATALKDAIANSQSKYVFQTSDGFRIKNDRINRYLNEYDISAKDLRGYSANQWIVSKLREVKDKEILGDEAKRKKKFNEIVKSVAEKVGHGAPTLKKHYMLPSLEREWVNNGKIVDLANIKRAFEDGGVINYARGGSPRIRMSEANEIKEYIKKQHEQGKSASFGGGIRGYQYVARPDGVFLSYDIVRNKYKFFNDIDSFVRALYRLQVRGYKKGGDVGVADINQGASVVNNIDYDPLDENQDIPNDGEGIFKDGGEIDLGEAKRLNSIAYGGYDGERLSQSQKRSQSMKSHYAQRKLKKLIGFDIGDLPSHTHEQKKIREQILNSGEVKKGGMLEFNDIVLYHEKNGNWFVPKNTVYAWLYQDPNAAKKLESGEFDFVLFPPNPPMSLAMQRGYVPPLLKIWTKKYQKETKGADNLLGIVKAWYDEKNQKLYIIMMTTRKDIRRKGVNSHIIKNLREEFKLDKDQIIFDKPTKEGEMFSKSGKYEDGGDIYLLDVNENIQYAKGGDVPTIEVEKLDKDSLLFDYDNKGHLILERLPYSSFNVGDYADKEGLIKELKKYGIDKGEKVWSIKIVKVKPRYRGQGVASTLLSAAIQWAKENKYEKLVLVVQAQVGGALSNEQLYELYSKFKFKPLKKTYGVNWMARKLDNGGEVDLFEHYDELPKKVQAILE